MVSEPCRSNPNQNWVTILVVCEWYSDTFGTCYVVLICWLWFCVEVRWMEDLVGMMRRLLRLWPQWPMCWLKLMFKGRYDLDGAQIWLQGVDHIFRAMVTSDDQKVRLATHMLAEEAMFWWANAKRKLEAGGAMVLMVGYGKCTKSFTK